MSSKHGYPEDEIHNLYVRRALLTHEEEGPDNGCFGIYGLEFEDLDLEDNPPYCGDVSAPEPSTGTHGDTEMIDPCLTYMVD